MTYLLRRARAGCRGRAGRSASLPAAAAVARAAKRVRHALSCVPSRKEMWERRQESKYA